ncbi:FMN-dependent NADH-azoreductase [Bacillus songklensis]|uniref:FMN dependent NADH:quinone oxidoreductase n=1 Tax=Bacillus songklensis TaxID=1069116 RepID=A0ABV8B4U0_9BACI
MAEKILYIIADPNNRENSFTSAIGRAFLDEYRATSLESDIVEIDIYQMDVPFIDLDVLKAREKMQLDETSDTLTDNEREKVSTIHDLRKQFLSADKYIFVTPLWNWTLPPKLKAYIDIILMNEKAFDCHEGELADLLKGKKAIHIQARCGLTLEGSDAEVEFGDRYLRFIMNLMGVHMSNSIIIEGESYLPGEVNDGILAAVEQARESGREFAEENSEG